MVRYEHSEIGRGLKLLTLALPLGLLAALTPALLEVISGQTHPGMLALLVVPCTILAFILPGISKLSVRLFDDALELRMGVFSRKILLRDVVQVRLVPVPWYAGWGVRYSFGGELWRVGGNRAVKLELRNGSSFSVGSSHVAELEQVIRSQLPTIN
jgi:hypothetical protein